MVFKEWPAMYLQLWKYCAESYLMATHLLY